MTAKVRKPRLHPVIFLGAVGGVLIFDALSSAAAQNVFSRIWSDLAARPSGLFSFRFVLQPTMAAIAAILDGIKDAHTGRSPYFWTVLSNPAERMKRLREGTKATSRIILLGLAMDAIYQVVVLRAFYPLEALIVAIALAFIPYLLIRGPAARIARRWQERSTPHGTSR